MPVELLIEGVDNASEVLERVSQKTEGMGAIIGSVAAAAAAVGGFIALAKGIESIVGSASEAQDSLSSFDAVFTATQRAAADQAATIASAGAATVAVSAKSQAAIVKLQEENTKLGLTHDVLAAKIVEQTKIDEINTASHKYSAEAVAVHAAALAKMKGDLEANTEKVAANNAEIAKLGASTLGLAAATAQGTVQTMMGRDALIAMSEAYAQTTRFSHEAVLGAEAVLLRFRDIGADTMPRATEMTLNLATSMGIDAASAATMLGKALVEPGVGLLRLKAAGIDFTKAQDEAIKKMVQSGDVAGAQKLILDALEKSIGGTAVAAGQTLTGELARAGHAMDDIKEKIGAALLPMLSAGTEGFIKFLGSGAVQADLEYVTFILKDLIGVVGGVSDSTTNLAADLASLGNQFGLNGGMIEDLVNGFFKLMDTLKGGDLSGAGSLLAEGFSNLVPALESLGQQLVQLVMGWVDKLGPPLLALVQQLAALVVAQLPVWLAAWLGFELALWAWVQNAVTPLLAALVALGRQLLGWVGAQLPGWLAALSALVGPLWAWVQAALGPLLAQLNVFANAMFQWVAAQVGPWATALGALIGPAVAWVLAALPGLLSNLGTFAGQLLSFVLQLAADAAGAFIPLALQFVSWVITDVLPKLPDVLGQILTALVGFLVALGDAVGPKLAELGKRFLDWVTAPGGPADQIGAKLAEFGKAITTWLTTTGATLGTKFHDLGAELMQSIGKGILDAVKAAIDAINAAIAALEAAIRAATNMHSPSQVYAGIGEMLMLGLAQGITAGTPAAVSALSGAMSTLQLSMAPVGVGAGGSGTSGGSSAVSVAPISPATPIQIVAHIHNQMDVEDLAYRVMTVVKRNGGY